MKKVISDSVTELDKTVQDAAENVVAGLIQKSGLDPDLEIAVGPIRVWAVLPEQGMLEDAMVGGYRDRNGNPLDLVAREPRVQRLLLSKIIVRLDDEVEFTINDDGDEKMKLLILSKLPHIMIESLWNGYMAQRTVLMLALTKSGGETLKKSQASRSGEHDGVSSVPKEESPIPETDSPN